MSEESMDCQHIITVYPGGTRVENESTPWVTVQITFREN